MACCGVSVRICIMTILCNVSAVVILYDSCSLILSSGYFERRILGLYIAVEQCIFLNHILDRHDSLAWYDYFFVCLSCIYGYSIHFHINTFLCTL